MTTYYQVRDSDGEVVGTFENFEKALINKPYGGEIRYFDGSIWILKVTKEIK